jgi:hypothetical protein
VVQFLFLDVSLKPFCSLPQSTLNLKKYYMASVVNSVHNIPIRLTEERWIHIVENHNEMAGYYDKVLDAVANPKWVVQGYHDELWAIMEISENKVLLAVYKEIKSENDGFIITAFFTSQLQKLKRRKMIWIQKQ